METLKKTAAPCDTLEIGDDEVCKNCRHFVRAPADIKNAAAPKVGLCYRFPPKVFLLGMAQHPLNPRQAAPQFCNARAQVGEEDFCGEFAPSP